MRSFFTCLALSSLMLFPLQGSADPLTAKETIEKFYRAYIAEVVKQRPLNLNLPFSRALNAEINQSDSVCKKYADGPCGWGADNDPYLNTQEKDSTLTYQNSGIKITELKPGTVQVTLNVYPSDRDNPKYYDKKLVYKMIQENNQWVVDDLLYWGTITTRKSRDYVTSPEHLISSRKEMRDEMKFYKEHPDKK